jgi:hypothetical protein
MGYTPLVAVHHGAEARVALVLDELHAEPALEVTHHAADDCADREHRADCRWCRTKPPRPIPRRRGSGNTRCCRRRTPFWCGVWPERNADAPDYRSIEILLALQPVDLVVELVPLFVARCDAHDEAAVEDAGNGAVEFSKMLDLGADLVADLHLDRRDQSDGLVRDCTARHENTGRAPPGLRLLDIENCPATLTMMRTSLRRSAKTKTMSRCTDSMTTSKQHLLN